MTGNLEHRIRTLERQLAELRLRTPTPGLGNPTVSTFLGATTVRPYQVGFPAELTGTFDVETGYPWKRLVLDYVTPEVSAPSPTETGIGAFTPDNDESLTSGQRGWMELDPGAGGYLFLPAAAGGGGVSSWKATVRCATTTAGTLASSFENGDTVDAVTLATGDRILIKNQADPTENGIYTVNASGAPTRAADDGGYDDYGAVVYVTEGSSNADTIWANTSQPSVSGTDPKWFRVWPILYANGGSSFSIASDDTWTDGSGTVTVPETGLYEISGTVTVEATVNAAGFDTVEARIVDNSGGGLVAPSLSSWNSWKLLTALVGPGFPAAHAATGGFSEALPLTAGTVLKFQARRNTGGGTTWVGTTVWYTIVLKPLR